MFNRVLDSVRFTGAPLPSRNAKFSIFEQFAIVAKALSHAHRLELLELLAQGERSVDALARTAGLSVANTSQHLQRLRRAGLVTARKDGLHVLYSLSGEDVVDLQGALKRTAERHVAEIDRVVSGYFDERDDLEAISREELLRRSKDGLVSILDVRPPEEYAAGHIPGAVNLSLKDLEKPLKEFPEGKEIIAYCRGTYCVLSFEAVAAIRKMGRKVRRLEEGYPEWKAAGLPVEAAE